MFSLAKLSVFATVAFSALASALPLSGVGALPDTSALTGLVSEVTGGGLLRRAAAPQSIAVVLTNAQTQITPFAQQLQFVNAQNSTVDHISGPAGSIQSILTDTVASLQLLVGEPLDIILLSVDGTAQITVHELGVLVGGLLHTVFLALGHILTLLGPSIDLAVHTLLITVGVLLGSVLTIVVKLVGSISVDLAIIVNGLLGDVVPFILTLGVTTIITLLGL